MMLQSLSAARRARAGQRSASMNRAKEALLFLAKRKPWLASGRSDTDIMSGMLLLEALMQATKGQVNSAHADVIVAV